MSSDPKLNAVPREEIAPKDEEEERSFQHQAHRRGKVHLRLELVSSHQEAGKENRDGDDRYRIDSRQPGNDDADITVSHRQSLLQPVVNSGNLGHPGKAGAPAV